MNERLKQVRKGLKLSQEFVAKQLGMTRTTIVAIEAGTRKVTTDELTKFSRDKFQPASLENPTISRARLTEQLQ